MKRYCKNIDITDFEFLEFCATECLRQKWHRRDVLDFFCKTTKRPKYEIKYAIRNDEKQALVIVAAHYMQKQLKEKKLDFVPIWYKEKIDSSNCKLRRIGIQNITQQLFDYVAVYAMKDFLGRIGEYQCASIPGRGQIYGVTHVYKWMREKDTKYVAQLDVQKCFPSIPQDKLLAFIDKYVANDDVKWLVRELVGTFDEGLSIGSYLSQYLCNVYMSQLYHKIEENMYYKRRGKRVNYVSHVLFYMDDISLYGSNAKMMHKAIKEIVEYTKNEMGLTIKVNWNVRKLGKHDFVDTMGFRVYRDHITIRRRVFKRVRRVFNSVLKNKDKSPTLVQARKCISYYGLLKNTNSEKFMKKYKVYRTIKLAKEVVANDSKLRYGATKRKCNSGQ